VLLSSGDSSPHLIQKPRSQLGCVTYLLNRPRTLYTLYTSYMFRSHVAATYVHLLLSKSYLVAQCMDRDHSKSMENIFLSCTLTDYIFHIPSASSCLSVLCFWKQLLQHYIRAVPMVQLRTHSCHLQQVCGSYMCKWKRCENDITLSINRSLLQVYVAIYTVYVHIVYRCFIILHT
jgi:hypothetical protein